MYYVVETLILALVLLYDRSCYADPAVPFGCFPSKNGDWVSYSRNGNCYRVFTTERSWSDALAMCNQPFSSTLLQLDNSEDYHFIKETGWVRIGSGLETCVPISLQIKRPPKVIFSGKCQTNWTEGPTGCYFIGSTTLWTMGEAQISQCHLRHNNSRLASFHSAEEMKLIASLHPIHLTSKRYFIGLMRYSEGIFSWLDGTPLNYLNWAPGQPANYDEQSACVEIDNLAQWHITSCHAKRGFICFLPKIEVDTHQLKANSAQFGKESQNSTQANKQTRMPNATTLTNTTVERDVSASNERMTAGQIVGIIFGVIIAAGLLFGLHIAHQRQFITIPCLPTPIGATRLGSYYDNPVHFETLTTET